ncbi:MAG TPA: SIMPL domain-containing protein [Rhizomicrobium sp.]|jgi:uncharacterized protein YggE|nr:SIMPL domain-containing protein [Rhizomicrobium sp.]
MNTPALRAVIFGTMVSTAALFAAAPAALADAAPRVLTVSGHGEASGAPDQATLSAGVTTQARTAAEALSENAAKMNALFSALKKIGVPDKKMQTSNFNVSPEYANDNTGNTPPRIVGYQVSNQVTVTLDDVKKVGPTLDTLVASGANQINSVGFGIDDPKTLLTSARGDAVADARLRAETYAKAAGVSLGNILSISDSSVSIAPPVPMYRAMAMDKAAASPIAAGEETVSADVTIVWEIR